MRAGLRGICAFAHLRCDLFSMAALLRRVTAINESKAITPINFGVLSTLSHRASEIARVGLRVMRRGGAA